MWAARYQPAQVVVAVVDAAGDEAEALEDADEEVALPLVVAGDEVGGGELEIDVLALCLVPGPALARVALRLADLHPLHGEVGEEVQDKVPARHRRQGERGEAQRDDDVVAVEEQVEREAVVLD